MHLLFDTETSGLPVSGPPNHPAQPRLLQLGAVVLDDAFHVRAELNMMVKWPAPVDIHPMALKAHGITYELTEKYGQAPELVLAAFEQMVTQAQHIAAFNSAFDYQIINIFGAQTQKPKPVLAQAPFCPMKALTPIMQLPGKFPGTYKWPTLQQAHVHCTGREFDGAHDAMADVRALVEVYKWWRKNNPELL